MSKLGLRIEGLSKSFHTNGSSKIHALVDFNLTSDSGEFIIIVGPNGSGKTTALNLIAGDYLADEGEIYLENYRDCRYSRATPPLHGARYCCRGYEDARRAP